VTTRNPNDARRLLNSAIAWFSEQGAAAAVGYFVRRSESWLRARDAGFAVIPRACSPREYPVYATVRPDDPRGPELLDPSRWHMSLADSDLA
jgi:hypothetical protein